LTTADDPDRAKVIDFQYETYAAAKLYQAGRSISFDSAYYYTFSRRYALLSEKNAAAAGANFDYNLADLRSNLHKLLTQQQGKDSIAMADARALLKAYNFYNVLRQVAPLARPMLAAAEKKVFIIEDSVLIPSANGSVIAAIVVRKRGVSEKQPAVLMFDIYADGVEKSLAQKAALNGFVGIVANTRGKRLSPQAIEPFEHDAEDAYHIIDWISRQPWSNQKVGMYGGSYLGFSQWAAVKKLHPALKTIIPQVAVGIGIDYPMFNNVFVGYMLQWIHYVTNNKMTDDADFNNSAHWDGLYRKWYAQGSSFRSLDTLEGRTSTIFQRWLQHPSYDSFWQRMVPYKNDFAAINIPVLTTTGYYDADQLGAMYYYRQHHLYNKQANHYLVIGPWNHSGAQGRPGAVLMDYPIDSVARLSIDNLAFQWFNYILKDSARPALLKDLVNYEVMGANEWKHAPSMDKINNDTLTYYLSPVRTGIHYKLTTQRGPEAFIQQEVNFADRGDSSYEDPTADKLINGFIAPGEGLSFVTAPFEQPVIVNGSFFGALSAKLNKKDIDVRIKLYELMPDGKYFSLSDYLGRASYATNRSRRQLLQPGRINTIPFANSFYTCRRLQKGSRLVVCVGINKTPDWQINYGSGKEVSDETIADGQVPLELQWYNSSYIKIPVQR